MKMTESKDILGNGVSFISWKMTLQAKLGRKNVLGHVFHDILGIHLLRTPTDPSAASSDANIPPGVIDAYLADLERWSLGEIEAKNIITQRLSPSIYPQHYTNLTAKQSYDIIAGTRTETATTSYAAALETFMSNINNAADSMATFPINSGYRIGERLASAVLVMGIKKIEWLSTWLDIRVYDSENSYASLQILMSSLRSIAGNRTQPPNSVAAVVPNSSDIDLEAYC
ncbi:hypothetical protein K3495_g960 [Podosphaera aphanis]|nr:hypothetical protein K3495_g960 [Podosphaera aphanis]